MSSPGGYLRITGATRVPYLSSLILPLRLIAPLAPLGLFAIACARQPMAPSAAPERASGMETSRTAELTRSEAVRQTLSRLTFGAQPGDVARVSRMGIDRWIDEQLAPSTIPDTAVER